MSEVLMDQNFWLDMLRYEYRIGKFYNSAVHRILIRSLFSLSTVFYMKLCSTKTKNKFLKMNKNTLSYTCLSCY